MVAPAEVKYYYLSQLLDAPVRVEGEAAPWGRLRDIGFQRTLAYPPACCIEVWSRARGTLALPWSAVKELSPREIVVQKANGTPPQADFWVRRDVLDDQVVDLTGARVRRVNDVQFLYAEGRLVAAHVEVGTLGLLRRLGVERPVRALLRWLFDYAIEDSFVTWKCVEVISPGGSPGGVRLSAQPSRLAELHPAELADILEHLGAKERQSVLRTLDVGAAAEALEEVAPDVQRTLITQEDPGKAADILDEMEAKEAADVLRDMHQGDAEKIISRMDSESAQDVRLLLGQDERTAGGMMTVSCVEARAGQTAAAVLDSMRPITDEVAEFNIIYVLDDARRLVGVIALRDLLRAASQTRIDELMITHIIKVAPSARLFELGGLFAKYGIRAIPVVDDGGVFLGTVRLKDVLYELVPQLRE
jgi:CBS domain-containing protein